MWNTRKFERHLESRLRSDFGKDRGDELMATYTVARTKLIYDIYKEIAGVEPNLSDHGADHVGHVLDNVRYLLSDHPNEHRLTATNLYVLGMAILFHDVGNLFKRKDHQKKIGEVFDWARGTDAGIRHEKTLILGVVRAHTGTASDGSTDALKDVPEVDQLHNERVELRNVSAILRFADELAEGPQRISEFRRRKGLYAIESKVFAEHSSITNIRADRGTQRILVTYEVEIDVDGNTPKEERSNRLQKLLDFAYERAIKLDQERRYARFYSSTLSPFRVTEITFNFHCRGNLLLIDLPPIRLDDKVVPGESGREIPEYDPRYKTDTLVKALMTAADQQK